MAGESEGTVGATLSALNQVEDHDDENKPGEHDHPTRSGEDEQITDLFEGRLRPVQRSMAPSHDLGNMIGPSVGIDRDQIDKDRKD